MMHVKRWDRPRLYTVTAIVVIEVLIGGYFLIYLSAMHRSQAERRQSVEQELETVRNDAGQLQDLQKVYDKAQRETAHLEPGTPTDHPAVFVPTLLTQLQDLAHASGLTVMTLNPQEPKPAANSPAAPPPPPANSPAGASDASTAAAAAAAAAPALEVPVTLSMRGTFAQLIAFLEGLKQFPKVVTVTSIQLRPHTSGLQTEAPVGVSPELGIAMEVSAEVLPVLAKVQ